MSAKDQVNKTWSRWDAAWEPNLSTPECLALLEECAAPSLVYTNPDTKIEADVEGLAERIGPMLKEAGDNLQFEHLKWYENNGQSALQWNSKLSLKELG
jgi:hypothetical protein